MKGGSIRATRCQPRTNTLWIRLELTSKCGSRNLLDSLARRTENARAWSESRISFCTEMDITQFDENKREKGNFHIPAGSCGTKTRFRIGQSS